MTDYDDIVKQIDRSEGWSNLSTGYFGPQFINAETSDRKMLIRFDFAVDTHVLIGLTLFDRENATEYEISGNEFDRLVEPDEMYEWAERRCITRTRRYLLREHHLRKTRL